MKTIYFSILFTLHFLLFTSLTAQVGNPAPDFTVTDVHGKKHHLYEYLNQGKKVVLDFFFTTCGPCIYYSPQVNLAYEKYGCNTQDVVFLSIDYNDTDIEVIDYENKYKIEFPSASGKDGGGNSVVSQYQIIAFPRLLLIDSTKNIIDEMDPPTLVVFDFKFAKHGLIPKPCLTSTSNYTNDESMIVYPNPSLVGNLVVSFSNSDIQQSQFEIIDFSGKSFGRLSTTFINNNTCSLDVNNIPVGNYLLKLSQINSIPRYSKISILK